VQKEGVGGDTMQKFLEIIYPCTIYIPHKAPLYTPAIVTKDAVCVRSKERVCAHPEVAIMHVITTSSTSRGHFAASGGSQLVREPIMGSLIRYRIRATMRRTYTDVASVYDVQV
jgi:hypothetical protein